MRLLPRVPRALAIALAAVALAVPVAGAALLASGGEGSPAAGERASREPGDAALPRARARAVEPVVGEPGVAAAPDPESLAAPAPRARPGDDAGLEISPGAPSDREIQEDLAALEREQARVERLLLSSNAPLVPGSGQLVLPVPGPLTSPFGPRWGRLHAGIDIAAPGGTAIRAADAGLVVIAGPQGGYGNYTCVRHSGAVATCYAHQTRILVSVGDVVAKGAVIGTVGSTGNSTGNHLHFEVRINGQPVDPLRYL